MVAGMGLGALVPMAGAAVSQVTHLLRITVA